MYLYGVPCNPYEYLDFFKFINPNHFKGTLKWIMPQINSLRVDGGLVAIPSVAQIDNA